MADFTITLSVEQVKAVRQMAASSNVSGFLQNHLDGWIQPVMDAMDEQDKREVAHAYVKADKAARKQVRQDLGLP